MILRLASLLLVAFTAAACATAPTIAVEEGPKGTPLPPGVYRVSDGVEISPEELIDALEAKPIVYIGESHPEKAHHEVQRMIVEGLARRSPGRVALGMEMFFRPFQAPLDAYVTGQIDEKAMLAQTEYEKRWGYDWSFYRPMVELMKLQGSHVVALNAPRELTQKVRQEGYEKLSDEEKAGLPSSLDAENPDHRAMIEAVLGGVPGHGEMNFDTYYRVQVLWDATMAASAVVFLEANPETRRMVILAGMFHVRDGLGIPFHVKAQGGPEGTIVIPVTWDEEDPVVREDVIGTGVGDYIWVAEKPAGGS